MVREWLPIKKTKSLCSTTYSTRKEIHRTKLKEERMKILPDSKSNSQKKLSAQKEISVVLMLLQLCNSKCPLAISKSTQITNPIYFSANLLPQAAPFRCTQIQKLPKTLPLTLKHKDPALQVSLNRLEPQLRPQLPPTNLVNKLSPCKKKA